MIYITGDTHGNQYRWLTKIHPVLKSGDTIIVTGDFGIGFWDGRFWPEEMFYDWINQQQYSVLFCDGNHCNYEKLNQYQVEIWNGGRVNKIRENLIHLIRGEIYTIESKMLFVFGGGFSRDRYVRQEGISWWADEMPSDDEYENAVNNLGRVNHKVDYIITHTAPRESIYYMSKVPSLGIEYDDTEELRLTQFLDNIVDAVSYKFWYFGHFHTDISIFRNQTAIYNSVRELESGKIVRMW